MAALWRRTPLALTRSTPCSGSASSPRRSSSSRSTSPCSTPCAATAPSGAPSRARSAAAAGSSSGSAPSSPSSPPRSSSSASSSPTRRGRRPATGAAGLAAAKAEPLTIEATGQQWLWRYDYPNGAFSYYKLVVPVDTAVELELLSTDVVHTWDVPDLAGKRDAVPGKINKSSSAPTKKATYERPVGDPLRPGLRGDADRGRSRLARRPTKPSSSSRKPTSRPPRTGSSA